MRPWIVLLGLLVACGQDEGDVYDSADESRNAPLGSADTGDILDPGGSGGGSLEDDEAEEDQDEDGIDDAFDEDDDNDGVLDEDDPDHPGP
jgi:hypothetical protein